MIQEQYMRLQAVQSKQEWAVVMSNQLNDWKQLALQTVGQSASIGIAVGGAAATAFHARSSQVSKTTETGESLARGSFIVRGERSWHKDVPLEVAIGLAVVNGVPMPVSGVPTTISEICERWARISPGREKKEAVANRISKSTGLSQEDVLSCLPPGGCSVEDRGLISP